MRQKSLFLSTCFFLFLCYTSKAQNNSSSQLVRSTIGVSGSSEAITANNTVYVVQQSIGQTSVIGTFSNANYILRQGFIQPNVWSKIINKDLPVSLEVATYPNPFVENITVAFTEVIKGNIEVTVFDVLGRLVFSNKYAPAQQLNITINNLSVAKYILKITANNKQFIKNIVKK
jgi:hypothetical protein